MHLYEDDGGKPSMSTSPVKRRISFLLASMSRRVDFPQPVGPEFEKNKYLHKFSLNNVQ